MSKSRGWYGMTSVPTPPPPRILANISSSHNVTQQKGGESSCFFPARNTTVKKDERSDNSQKIVSKEKCQRYKTSRPSLSPSKPGEDSWWERRYWENNRALIRTRNRIYQKRYKQRHKKKNPRVPTNLQSKEPTKNQPIPKRKNAA